MDRHRETEIRDGWLWPIKDKRCWRATMRHIQMPQEIIQHVEKRRVAVQAGGNCGVYAKQYADHFETLYTFEPENLNFYCLTQNLSEHNNVYKIQSFLGKGTEHTAGIRNPADKQSEPNSGMFEKHDGPGAIPVLAIDQLGLDNCDLIHLDIEGGEYDALLGAEQTIKQFRPLICLEWFQNQEKLADLIESWAYRDIGMASQSDKMFIHPKKD